MKVVKIDTLAAPELEPYARLTEAQLRNRLHASEGLFICESMKVIRVALAAGVEPVSFLCEEKFLGSVPDCGRAMLNNPPSARMCCQKLSSTSATSSC